MSTTSTVDRSQSGSDSIWLIKYDESLGQYYYLNESNNTVSFDLPCEVKTSEEVNSDMKPGKFLGLIRRSSLKNNKCQKKGGAMLSRITTKLSLKKSRSNETVPSPTNISQPLAKSESMQTPFIASSLDDDFLLNNPNDFNNFAGTSLVGQSFTPSLRFNSEESSLFADSESESIDSYEDDVSEEESVRSFFMEDNNYTTKYPTPYHYNDYHYYYTENEVDEDDVETNDVEAERALLRMQMLAELE